jgi:hypothetical protein
MFAFIPANREALGEASTQTSYRIGTDLRKKKCEDNP